MAAGQSPLRRWRRFFPAFDAIDAAIEAGAPGSSCASRAEHRQARGDIVEKLCNAAADDGDGDGEELAEGLCLLLDEAMAEALATLRLVRVTPAMLTATDLARAVGGLRRHEAERVRGLARDVFGRWKAAIEGDLSRVRAALEKLEHKAAAAPVTGDVRSGDDRDSKALQEGDKKQRATAKIPEPPKKTPPVIGSAGCDRQKTETVKRKLLDGYSRESEDAKRRKAAEMVEQRRTREGHPMARQRERSRSSSTAERRFLTSSHRKDRV
ncbi:hypothetical protein ACP70R_031472 [Stipagrostis hirtigluma subsp. patula]